MKKNVTVITLLLLIVSMLSGCGNKPNEDLQQESVQTTEPKAEDVLLSYEYDSNGEISKVVFLYQYQYRYNDGFEDDYYITNIEFSEIKTEYDTNGHLTSITAESNNPASGRYGISSMEAEAKYNTDGQITSLTCTGRREQDPDIIRNYEVVYNSSDNYYAEVHLEIEERCTQEITDIYDSNCKLLSREVLTMIPEGWYGDQPAGIERAYIEYVNGILSHGWYYGLPGWLDNEVIYDNGILSHRYVYSYSTGRLEEEDIRHDNGDIEEINYDEETGEIESRFLWHDNGDGDVEEIF